MTGTISIFPTPVGVNRRRAAYGIMSMNFPHARGGEPEMQLQEILVLKFSPRPWG